MHWPHHEMRTSASDQPQRGGTSQPGATPRVGGRNLIQALKGRDNPQAPHGVPPFQGLVNGLAMLTRGVAPGCDVSPRWGFAGSELTDCDSTCRAKRNAKLHFAGAHQLGRSATSRSAGHQGIFLKRTAGLRSSFEQPLNCLRLSPLRSDSQPASLNSPA
jgi:hypothetical protein